MKGFLISIFFFSTCVYAQQIRINEIKLKPKPSFYKVSKATIIYPLVVTNNKSVDKLINHKIREEIVGDGDETRSLKESLNERISEGLINLSYEVTFKKYNILSMNIYTEGCGAHCSSMNTYFNFDLKTGKDLDISDLISDNMIDSFRNMVFNDKKRFIKNYKKQLEDDLAKMEVDSSTHSWVLEHVDGDCTNSLRVDEFSLSNLNILISDPCEFPHVIKALEPTYELLYSYKLISAFLRPELKRKFLK